VQWTKEERGHSDGENGIPAAAARERLHVDGQDCTALCRSASLEQAPMLDFSLEISHAQSPPVMHLLFSENKFRKRKIRE
jgi:hypothetical protein